MKKIVIAAAIALCGFMSIPAQAQELSDQPWRLVNMVIVPTGFFGPFIKTCVWKRSIYVNGVYSYQLNTTQARLFSSCPTPTTNIQ